MKELWKKVEEEGYKGLYEVSNFGRVRSNHGRKRFLTGSVAGTGKYKYIIFRKNNKIKGKYMHRLVAEAFLPNPQSKPQVNHKDGNRLNNHVDNLEWCTCGENHKHAYRLGLRKRLNREGENNGNAKLNKHQVARIRLIREVAPSLGYRRISKMFDISTATIRDILKNRTWKDHNTTNIS